MTQTARCSSHGALRQGHGKNRIRLRHLCLLVLWVCAVLFGCDKSGRQALDGTVTLDGEPLPQGSIVFFPQPGTRGPTAGDNIVDGRFSIAPAEGTMAGTFRVEITASRKTGRKVADPTVQMMNPDAESALIDQTEQYIPARYNKQSELTAEVQEGRSNSFEFELTSP